MKTLIIVILLSGLNADNMIEKDLAFRLVRDEMQNSNVPEAFLREVFTHDGIAIDIASKTLLGIPSVLDGWINKSIFDSSSHFFSE